jgi:hypothetical protein
MYDAVFDQLLEPLAYLLEILDALDLSEMFGFLNCRFEVASVAELLYHIIVVRSLQDVDEAHYRLTFQLLHDFDLRQECVLHVLVMVD